MTSFETIITARRGWFDIHFKEIWRYRDLIMLFVRRNFVANYKQTVLGPAWAILQPLLTTVVFTIVFGRLARLSTDGLPPFLFYMCGNMAWGYFAGCLNSTANTFIGNAGMFGKVYFPRLVMPIASVLGQLISFSIQFIMLLGFMAYYSVLNHTLYLTWSALLLPLIVLQMAMLGLGCGIIISALTTKYRDLAMLVGFGLQLWMYGTPVVYSITMVPAKYKTLYMCNPMVCVIETFRDCFFGTSNLSGMDILFSWGVTILIMTVGIVLFSHVEKTFMDTI